MVRLRFDRDSKNHFHVDPPWVQNDVLKEGKDVESAIRRHEFTEDEEYDEIKLEATTRRIIRTQKIPDPPGNVHDATAVIKATLLAQRRSRSSAKQGEEWQDAESFSLATLKAGQHVKLDLSPTETKRLFLVLTRRFAEAGSLEQILGELSLSVGRDDEVFIAKGKEKEAIEALLEHEGDGIWDHLGTLAPGMVKTIGLRRQHEDRLSALETFRSHMELDDWREQDWQKFFEDNTWIFGFGLAYQFMNIIDGQPHFGGTRLDGTGAQRGDYLARTEADARFTVLVEIKKPGSELMHSTQYRPGGGIYRVSTELSGGVAQVQGNCETWMAVGAREVENVIELDRDRTYTHEPKGILIIGHTKQLEVHRGKAASFERFRRLVHNPEIVTFDELYRRAEYLVQMDHDRVDPVDSGNVAD